ncbi:MAG TPA: metallopeptidase TldD-related protein, partial [Kofleriaceae bacterium]|nr:metallopeptidase TldD-related protein [Kofleriaceae bacterium]
RPHTPHPDPVTAAGAPARRAAAYAPHRAAGIDFAGSLKATRRRLWVRTSAGASGDHDGAAAEVRMIARAAAAAAAAGSASSGHACAAGPADHPLDLAAVAAAAADRALRGRDPIDVDPGRHDVVLAPAAVAELIEWMAEASFRGTALIDGTSLLAGRAGAPVCDPRVTISDRPGPGDPPFDAEGTPRRPVAFIRDGVGGHALTDRLTALRLGDAGGSTGHAAPLGDLDFGTPGPQHLWLAPGDATEDQLCAGIERGIYVTRFFYVNGLLDTRRATMTGMTRDGTFLIEHGRLGRGVRNLRFTDSILEALGAERLGGIGREAVDIPTWWTEGGVITVPALLLRAFHFTGTSR